MDPAKYTFYQDRVSKVIFSVLEEELKDKTYNFATFSKLTVELSDRIKEKVKAVMDLPRHKVVSFVTIGEMKGQGVKVGSRSVWRPQWDHYASVCYSNRSLFAVGVIYATYFE